MLYDYVLLQIKNEHLIFQQDWAPPNCANIVCELMNEKFLRCRLGQDWREAWQPRSPDPFGLLFMGLFNSQLDIFKIQTVERGDTPKRNQLMWFLNLYLSHLYSVYFYK